MVTTRSASHALLSSPAPAAATKTTVSDEATEAATNVPPQKSDAGKRVDGDLEAEAELPLRTRTRSQRQSQSQNQTPSPPKKRKSPTGGSGSSLSPSKRKRKSESDSQGYGLEEEGKGGHVVLDIRAVAEVTSAPGFEAEVAVGTETQDMGAELPQRAPLPKESSNRANDLSNEGSAGTSPAEFASLPSITDADHTVATVVLDSKEAAAEIRVAVGYLQPSPTGPVPEEEKDVREKGTVTESHVAGSMTAGPALPEIFKTQDAQEELTVAQPEEEVAGAVEPVAPGADEEGTVTMPIEEVSVRECKDGEKANLEELVAMSFLEERVNIERSMLGQTEIELPSVGMAPSSHVELSEVDQDGNSVDVPEEDSFITAATSKPDQTFESDDDDAPDVLNWRGPGIHSGGVALPKTKLGRKEKTKVRLSATQIESSRLMEAAVVGYEPMVPEDSPVPEFVPAAVINQPAKEAEDIEVQKDIPPGTSKKRKRSLVWFEPPAKKSKDVVKNGTIHRRVLGVPIGVASLSPKSTSLLRKVEVKQNGRGGRLSLLKDRRLQTTWGGRRSNFVRS